MIQIIPDQQKKSLPIMQTKEYLHYNTTPKAKTQAHVIDPKKALSLRDAIRSTIECPRNLLSPLIPNSALCDSCGSGIDGIMPWLECWDRMIFMEGGGAECQS